MQQYIVFALLLLVESSLAFYLPGMAPIDYKRGDKIELHANSLSSAITEISYDFYHPRLHFPKGSVVAESEGLGSVLMGNRLVSTIFNVSMLVDEPCKFLGEADFSAEDAKFMHQRILEEYTHNWELDHLPGVTHSMDGIAAGFPIGWHSDKQEQPPKTVLYNYFTFTVLYHKNSASNAPVLDDITVSAPESTDANRVVGFDIDFSSAPFEDGKSSNCKADGDLEISPNGPVKAFYYYTVIFKEDPDTQWVNRWDRILQQGQAKIHWFNIAHSLIIVVFLMAMVGMILLRTLHRDISRYNQLDAQEDAQEEFGWKLVHTDVFRPPQRYMWLSVMVGNGAQLFIMSCVTLFFALLGFLSPSSRGSFINALIVSYVLSGVVAGYVSGIVYKMFGGEAWKRNVLLTAFVIPGMMFCLMIFFNFFLIGAHSSSAVPFTTMLALMALWFLISVPLCFIGAFRAFKLPRIENPVRTNQIPRQIPEQPFYMRDVPAALMGGILPFGAIFVELYFIMNSIWSSQFYYVFGFLFIIGTILILTCATVSILMCYFQLCGENYKWWWRSFFSSGSSALYVFLNSVIYYMKRPNPGHAASFFIYFGYSLVMSGAFFLVTGFIGFVSCWLFVRKIYASIKID